MTAPVSQPAAAAGGVVEPTPGGATYWLEGYEITRDGRVFSKTHNWRGYGLREMRQTPDDHGYLSVRLTMNGRRSRIAIHRLVAAAHLPPRPSPQHEVRHLDGNKINNRADNLRWGTRKENAEDRQQHGRTSRGALHAQAIVAGQARAAIAALNFPAQIAAARAEERERCAVPIAELEAENGRLRDGIGAALTACRAGAWALVDGELQRALAQPAARPDVAKHVCDYPTCSARGAGHPLACGCRSAHPTNEPRQAEDRT